jgi:AmmeMemoRadiSam system protein A
MSKLSETPAENPQKNLPGHIAALQRPEFSAEQRRTLLAIAHQAILSVVAGHSFPDTPPGSPLLLEPRGVFTTLYLSDHLRERHGEGLGDALNCETHPEHRQLRGCVGYAVPVAPLYRAVAETACAAAFEDSRFHPVTNQEAPRLEVSLSVLSRLFPIHPRAVEIGRHGLVISIGSRRGLLLPQVPTEYGWDRETFLDQTCLKAGLPLDAWRKDAIIQAFTAEVFADTDFAGTDLANTDLADTDLADSDLADTHSGER